VKPIIALLANVLLVACSPRPGEFANYSLSESDLAAVQQTVRTSFKDPQSAHFGQIMAVRSLSGEVKVCGLVNAKNRFGDYTGAQHFFGTLSQGSFALIKLDYPSFYGESAILRCKSAGMVMY
jgi:hypothetical protein